MANDEKPGNVLGGVLDVSPDLARRWREMERRIKASEPREWQREYLGRWAEPGPVDQRPWTDDELRRYDRHRGRSPLALERERDWLTWHLCERYGAPFNHRVWSAFCQQWLVVALCASPLADVMTERQRGTR